MDEAGKSLKAAITIVVVIGIVCIAGLIACLIKCRFPKPEPNLIIEDETIATWITLENKILLEPESCERPFWNGLLFQLGKYEGASMEFRKVEVKKESGEVVTLHVGDFAWINIVSSKSVDAGSGCPEPISPDKAFLLYPEGDPMSPEEKIHQKFLPEAIITYWQGAKGWSVDSAETPKAKPYNEHRFRFKDDFIVEIYKATKSDSGWSMVLLGRHEGVKSIKILGEKGPELGTKQDPPWRGP